MVSDSRFIKKKKNNLSWSIDWAHEILAHFFVWGDIHCHSIRVTSYSSSFAICVYVFFSHSLTLFLFKSWLFPLLNCSSRMFFFFCCMCQNNGVLFCAVVVFPIFFFFNNCSMQVISVVLILLEKVWSCVKITFDRSCAVDTFFLVVGLFRL